MFKPTSPLVTTLIHTALAATVATSAVVLVTKYVAPLPLSISQTTTSKDTAFMVSGKSTITTVPDKAILHLGISRKESSIKVAQNQANQVINTIKQKLLEMGLKKEDIQTDNYSIYPNYDYSNPAAQRITGYSVDVGLTVSLSDFDQLNSVIDMSTQSGANTVGNVQFSLSDSKERELKQEARTKAIEDAQKNAESLAHLSGLRLGRVINVTEGTQSLPRPYMATAELMKDSVGMGGGVPTSIEPGSATYNYSVTLSYETL